MASAALQRLGIDEQVRRGLLDKPRSLPSVLFYDEAGSRLFEAICSTPEYYIPRTETELLKASVEGILDLAGDPYTVVELGSGSARKTRILLEALERRRGKGLYVPVDISGDFLRRRARRLGEELPGTEVQPLEADYAEGLRQLHRLPRPALLVFLGSSIGNFPPQDQADLLRAVAARLRPGDRFLLGTDLVKDARVLHAAYNDAAGATAAFNINLLAHLNLLYDGDADPRGFEHVAFWNGGASRVEMHLRSRRDQCVRLRRLQVRVELEKGEAIHTEDSYKFTVPGLLTQARSCGLEPQGSWTDARGYFALHLFGA